MSEHLQLQFLHYVDKLTSKKYAETIKMLRDGFWTQTITQIPTKT